MLGGAGSDKPEASLTDCREITRDYASNAAAHMGRDGPRRAVDGAAGSTMFSVLEREAVKEPLMSTAMCVYCVSKSLDMKRCVLCFKLNEFSFPNPATAVWNRRPSCSN